MPTLPKRILITGASGFVGRHLERALAAAYPDAALFTSQFDVCDAAQVSAVISSVAPSACIHLAAISTIAAAQADEDHAWQVNLHGTRILARAILQHVPDCQFIFASSGDTYGASFRTHARVNEATPLAPLNTYAATKAAADLMLGSMAERGLRVVRLRAFNHTGVGQGSQFVIPAFARQLMRIAADLQEPVLQVGNLEPCRDFLDVRDVCEAYIACIANRDSLETGMPLVIASGNPRRIGTILDDLQALAGVSVTVQVDRTRQRSIDVPLACGDASRAHTVLGWAPRIPWEQTLQDVINDWRSRVAAEPGAV